MLVVAVVNLALNFLIPVHVSWALIPIGIFSFGWSLMVPVVTLLVLDLVPERRGMASSLQAAIGSAANGVVAGVLAPLVMHSTHLLAFTSLALMLVGLGAWLLILKRWPDTGRLPPKPV
jgi:DHA1 family bicyclomycin/chloramphenicol resistance-like MFS transporter